MQKQKILPVIGVTMGDPLGIGPEIVVKALLDPGIHTLCRPVVIGDANIIRQAGQLLGSVFTINEITDLGQAAFSYGVINLLGISKLDFDPQVCLSPTPETGMPMQDYILKGIDLALNKQIDGIATCPITKTAMKLANSKFHGHTELLASRTHTMEYAMMLAGTTLKVVLVTIHMPLARVSSTITTEKIIKTIRLTASSLKSRFGIDAPRIAVAGFNPHAGEESMFGLEEEKIIAPAVRKATQEGILVKGPLPPDTVFYQAVNKKYDAVVCMYHDQGLIPFKLVHFKDGVNTTLGLPIIRTSVDHGTAYDIAWKGIADHTSLVEAIKMAAFQAVKLKE